MTADAAPQKDIIFPEWLAHEETLKRVANESKEERDAALPAGDAVQQEAKTGIQSWSEDATRWTKEALGLPKKED
ncbi:unnamed protein product, partial [Rotaria socialis]